MLKFVWTRRNGNLVSVTNFRPHLPTETPATLSVAQASPRCVLWLRRLGILPSSVLRPELTPVRRVGDRYRVCVSWKNHRVDVAVDRCNGSLSDIRVVEAEPGIRPVPIDDFVDRIR